MTFPKDRRYRLPNHVHPSQEWIPNNEIQSKPAPKGQHADRSASSFRETDSLKDRLLGLKGTSMAASGMWKQGDRAYLPVYSGGKRMGYMPGVVGFGLPGGKVEFYLERDLSPLDSEVRFVVPIKALRRTPEVDHGDKQELLGKISN